MQIGPVAHRSGHCDHRLVNKSSDDACQSTLHPRRCNHTVGTLDHIQAGQKPVESADSHVVDALHVIAEKFRCPGRFLGHRNIRRASRTDRDPPNPFFVRLFNFHNTGDRIICKFRKFFPDKFKLSYRGSRAEYFSILFPKPLKNAGQMVIGLAAAENHLGGAVPQFSVGIQFGISHILKGLPAEKCFCLPYGHFSPADFF